MPKQFQTPQSFKRNGGNPVFVDGDEQYDHPNKADGNMEPVSCHQREKRREKSASRPVVAFRREPDELRNLQFQKGYSENEGESEPKKCFFDRLPIRGKGCETAGEGADQQNDGFV